LNVKELSRNYRGMTETRETPIEQTLRIIEKTCTSNGLQYAVIGGIAATLYGSARTTIDVDLIVKTEVDSIGNVFDVFTRDFVPLKARPLEFFRTYYVLPLVHKASQVKVDVSAALSGFEHSALKRARSLHFGAVEATFCSAEDLILFKLIANRERDRVDVKEIVTRRMDRLDWPYLRSTAAQFVEVERPDIQATLEEMFRLGK
jgi:predicted nucleotidyltransferase